MSDKNIKNQPKSDDTERLVARINNISHRMLKADSKFSTSEYSRLNKLSDTEISVLSLLYNNPQMIMRDISTILNVSKSTITGIIDNLEKYGFVERVLNKKDRRSYALAVTEEGKLAQKEHLEWENENYLDIIKAMKACSIDERLLDDIEKILDYFGI